MDMKKGLIGELESAHKFFNTSTRPLTEEDSTFKPKEMQFTVAQHVAHVAQTIDWFLEGAFRAEGFDLDFEKHDKIARACNSLHEAREWLKNSIARAVSMVKEKSLEEWQMRISEGPVMGGAPRFMIVSAITDHTAHHRGALTVYTRLLGKVPPMPYGD